MTTRHTDPYRDQRLRLMAERTAAINRRDWAELDRLTAALAALPVPGGLRE